MLSGLMLIQVGQGLTKMENVRKFLRWALLDGKENQGKMVIQTGWLGIN
jgi:hypothetical protein